MLGRIWARIKQFDAAIWAILGSSVLVLADLLDYLPLDDLLAAVLGDEMRASLIVTLVPLVVAYVRWRAGKNAEQSYDDRLDDSTPTEPF